MSSSTTLDQFGNPPGTKYSAWRGPFPCKHAPKSNPNDACGLQITMKFATLPDGVTKGKHAIYETDQITRHVHRQDRQQPTTPVAEVPQTVTRIGRTDFKNPRPEQTEKDAAIQAMFDEKRQWHEDEGKRHEALMMKLDMIVGGMVNLANALNRYIDYKERHDDNSKTEAQ